MSNSNTPPDWTPTLLRQALTEILERHTLWVRTNGAEGERLSLRGANLVEADLDGADMWKASLKKTNLVAADFGEANLERACFWRATLTGADFGDADLIGVDLREARTKAVVQPKKLGAHTPR